MKVTEDFGFKQHLLSEIEKREFSDRSGVHSSDLIYCLSKQALRKMNPQPASEHDLLLFSLGLSTQAWLVGSDKDVPSIDKDGILVTCDSLYCPNCQRLFNGR